MGKNKKPIKLTITELQTLCQTDKGIFAAAKHRYDWAEGTHLTEEAYRAAIQKFLEGDTIK